MGQGIVGMRVTGEWAFVKTDLVVERRHGGPSSVSKAMRSGGSDCRTGRQKLTEHRLDTVQTLGIVLVAIDVRVEGLQTLKASQSSRPER